MFIKYALLKEQYSLKYFLFFGSPELGLELHGIVGPKSLPKFCAYVIVHIRNFPYMAGGSHQPDRGWAGLCLLKFEQHA